MTCINPPALTDEQLNAALDDLADEAVMAHLETCAFCRAELESMHVFDELLKKELHRWECPSVQILGDYELDMLPSDQMRIVKAHVRECPRCQAELNALRDFMNAPDLPVTDALRQRPKQDGSFSQMPHRNSNWLVAQPLQDVAAYASRGVASVGRSQRGASDSGIDLDTQPLHEVKGITIFMEVREGSNNQLTLVGQLILEDFADWTDALVELRQAGSVKTVSAVNETAGFRCRLANRDPFDVTITSRKGTVLLLRDVQPKR